MTKKVTTWRLNRPEAVEWDQLCLYISTNILFICGADVPYVQPENGKIVVLGIDMCARCRHRTDFMMLQRRGMGA